MFKKTTFALLPILFLLGSACTPRLAKDLTGAHPYEKKLDIRWASPQGFDLTMDIYTPQTGRKKYPVIIIYHGGGWLINNKSIMDQSAAYLAEHGQYVVCNVNYRLLGDQGNTVTMDQIIEDAFGAVLWVKEHIADYKGDPENIIVTGDSAGGHLATMVAMQGQNLESDGFEGNTLGFKPSYLPPGKTAEQVAAENGMQVQAAMISYGAFDLYAAAQGNFEEESNFFWTMGHAQARGIFGNAYNPNDNPERYKQVSPNYLIQPASAQKLPPMLFTVGSKDNLTTPESIKAFMEKLRAAGHTELEYWENEGRPHAFLDSGSNPYLGITFEKDAPPALDVMINFLNQHFYQ